MVIKGITYFWCKEEIIAASKIHLKRGSWLRELGGLEIELEVVEIMEVWYI